MDWFDKRKCALPSDRIFSALLRELPRAGYIITACDRASGFIGLYRGPRWNSIAHIASVLVEADTETSSTVLVGSANWSFAGLVRRFTEARNRRVV